MGTEGSPAHIALRLATLGAFQPETELEWTKNFQYAIVHAQLFPDLTAPRVVELRAEIVPSDQAQQTVVLSVSNEMPRVCGQRRERKARLEDGQLFFDWAKPERPERKPRGKAAAVKD